MPTVVYAYFVQCLAFKNVVNNIEVLVFLETNDSNAKCFA